MRTNIDYKSGSLTYAEVKLIKNRLNSVYKNPSLARETLDIFHEEMPNEGYAITSEQTEKGLKWLFNKWKSPKGGERKNNPFGLHGQHVLSTFKEFRLVNWYATGRLSQFPHYFPVYRVIAENGSSFDYYGHGGGFSFV